MITNFLIKSKNISKDSIIWNMIGSLLIAFQSVIMLIILTRTVGLVYSGIFTIAYANANLFLNIGKYGIRNYQVSDVNKKFSFSDYLLSRILTTFIMLVFSILYVYIVANQNNYTTEKANIIIWMCLFKAVDSIEDVYLGMYQQEDRLDVAGKVLSIRMFATIGIFGFLTIVTGELLLPLIITTIFTTICFIILIIKTIGIFDISYKRAHLSQIRKLLKKCFPLFLSSFLAFYIGNAPKYAIDSQLSDDLQACYGFIAMPVFVIGLLNSFVFNPMITRMSLLWNENNIKDFKKIFKYQIIIILLITIICEFGAYVIGIPVLSFMYNTDLTAYKNELLILLLGGGFLAFSGLLVTIITIIRLQKTLLVGYSIVSILAYFASPVIVNQYGMLGAAVLYLCLMAILCVTFIIPLLYGFKNSKANIL